MADQASEGIFSPFLRSRRISAVSGLLKGRVLDVGCGSGALAHYVDASNYLGVDIDEISLEQAKVIYPCHSFVLDLSKVLNRFETIVSLAVIEHMADPVKFLQDLDRCLDDLPTAKIIVTTPHPSLEWAHNLGAKLRLFSRQAHEEHETLLGKLQLKDIGQKAGLKLESYEKFLWGANQLAIFSKCST